MKVLWLVNIIMPELAEHLGQTPTVFGGWLQGAQSALNQQDIQLVICALTGKTELVGRYVLPRATYYLVCSSSVNSLQSNFQQIIHDELPDLVHIFGTEFVQSWALASVAPPEKMIITMQGAVIYYRDATFAGIPEQICHDTLLHKVLRKLKKGGNSIELQKKSFALRAEYEKKALESARYINGLSDWGDAVVRSVNQNCLLLPCGSILRDPFYSDPHWDYQNCEKHSIYTIYSYPIKGFHKLVEALSIVVRYYPDVKVYAIAKSSPYRNYRGLKRAIMNAAPDYEWYVQGLIDKYHLREHIIYPGFLNAAQVKAQLLKANVFVSAASIENQPTALGEAMITGVPCVASCVGDVENMIVQGKEGFIYPFDQPQLLAHYICKLFESPALCQRVSAGARRHASVLFGREENRQMLLDMYDKVLQEPQT